MMNKDEKIDEFYQIDDYFFSESVDRAFGQNMFVPSVGLTVVFPLTPYAKANGRKLTQSADSALKYVLIAIAAPFVIAFMLTLLYLAFLAGMAGVG
jgi:hypothetical protein